MSHKRSSELEDLHSLCMLQLARASREAFAAHAKYRHLRIQEIEVMHLIAVNEYEEAEAAVQNADRQVGEVQHLLTNDGRAMGDGTARFLLHKTSSDVSSIGGISEAAADSRTPSDI